MRVRDTRRRDERLACPEPHRLAADEEREAALDDVERLGLRVDVRRRHLAAIHRALDDREARPRGALAARGSELLEERAQGGGCVEQHAGSIARPDGARKAVSRRPGVRLSVRRASELDELDAHLELLDGVPGVHARVGSTSA